MSRGHAPLGAAYRVLLLATLLLAPTQLSVQLLPGIHLTPADVTFGLAVLFWLAELVAQRAWSRLRPPPWTHVAFVGLACVSALRAPDRAAAVKDLIQIGEYFIVATIVFDDVLRRGGARRLGQATALFLGVGACIVGWAAWQYLAGGTDALAVRGSFGNRNVLGGYLALLLPVAFGLCCGPLPLRLRIGSGGLILAALAICLSGAAVLAIAVALLATAACRGRVWFAAVCAALVAGQAWFLPQLPRANDRALFASMAIYDDAGQPTRRYPEWQAAAAMAVEHPWLGVGLGNYQRQIGPYYGVVPNATGPAEPDIQNLYLVLAASAGLPACAAFLAMLLSAAVAAAGAPVRDWRAGLRLGIPAALGAFALTAVWNPLLVRGIGLPLAMLLAAARHIADTDPTRPNCQEGRHHAS